MTSHQPKIPDPETSKRLLANLHQTHIEMQEFNQELAEISRRLAEDLLDLWARRQKRMSNS